MLAHVVVFRVPETFDLAEFPKASFLYLKNLDLLEPIPPAADKKRLLYSYWLNEDGYKNEGDDFRLKLGGMIGEANPSADSVHKLLASGEKQGWLKWLVAAVIAFLVGLGGAAKWGYEQWEMAEKYQTKIQEMQSEPNIHLIPPKKILLAAKDEQEIPIEIHNFSAYNSPEVAWDAGEILNLQDQSKTALTRPAVFQFPEIKKGENKVLTIAWPRLPPGKYEMRLALKASAKIRSASAKLDVPVEVWARWTERRRPDNAQDKAKQDAHYCESRWEILPGEDFDDWHVQATLEGVPQVQFLGVDCRIGTAEQPLLVEDVAWIRWQIKHLKRLEPVPFSLILSSDVDRTPAQWEEIQKKIKINKGPIPSK